MLGGLTVAGSNRSVQQERNKLLGPDDICLANIDQIYQVSSDRKKRLLAAGSSIVSSIKTLQIVCKVSWTRFFCYGSLRFSF